MATCLQFSKSTVDVTWTRKPIRYTPKYTFNDGFIFNTMNLKTRFNKFLVVVNPRWHTDKEAIYKCIYGEASKYMCHLLVETLTTGPR